MDIQHHGAVNGVTGSCHQLHIDQQNSILIDCGLFQGAEQEKHNGADNNEKYLAIDFNIDTVQALIITHCHIDHVGRIPYLLAAGFRGPIYATTATVAYLGKRIDIKAAVHTISGYSAHADQSGLINFVKRIAPPTNTY